MCPAVKNTTFSLKTDAITLGGWRRWNLPRYSWFHCPYPLELYQYNFRKVDIRWNWSQKPYRFLRFALSKGGVFDMLLDGVNKKMAKDQLLHYNLHAWRVFWEPLNLVSQNYCLSKGGFTPISPDTRFVAIRTDHEYTSLKVEILNFQQHFEKYLTPKTTKLKHNSKFLHFKNIRGRHVRSLLAYFKA